MIVRDHQRKIVRPIQCEFIEAVKDGGFSIHYLDAATNFGDEIRP